MSESIKLRYTEHKLAVGLIYTFKTTCCEYSNIAMVATKNFLLVYERIAHEDNKTTPCKLA